MTNNVEVTKNNDEKSIQTPANTLNSNRPEDTMSNSSTPEAITDIAINPTR